MKLPGRILTNSIRGFWARRTGVLPRGLVRFVFVVGGEEGSLSKAVPARPGVSEAANANDNKVIITIERPFGPWSSVIVISLNDGCGTQPRSHGKKNKRAAGRRSDLLHIGRRCAQ